MQLSALSASTPGATLHASADCDITSIAYDSRQTRPGSLFAAIRGEKSDGFEFIDAAVKRGAVAALCDRPPGAPIPWVEARDVRLALAEISASFFGNPASALTLCGVTGTNGKTTTAFLIDAALRSFGKTTGLLGTVESRIASRPLPATLTTPESLDLQQLLRQMADEHVSHVAMEVSSHALVQHRVAGLRFKAAVFTNLTRDHLDFHHDMESYFEAKAKLFKNHLHPEGVALLNVDDAFGARLASELPDSKRRTFSVGSKADYVARDIELRLDGTSFLCATPSGSVPVHSPLIGEFNVRNLLGAFGAVVALGFPVETAARALASLSGVPGRMERVDEGQPFAVVVDYAHTDDALKNVLDTVRQLGPRRVITVFGCGGDRDRSKRPLMGAVAAQRSDLVIATSDNPRSESPAAILDEIKQGFAHRATETRLVVDRREAIGVAIDAASEGDVVVIAGKGHETTQTLHTGKIPFDDRQVAREALRQHLKTGH